jgi:hypothetical protein
LLDGLDGNPQAYLSADNGGRVLVKVRDFHPSRLIKQQQEGVTALAFTFIIGRDPVMNDRLGQKAHNGGERFQISLGNPQIHGDGGFGSQEPLGGKIRAVKTA